MKKKTRPDIARTEAKADFGPLCKNGYTFFSPELFERQTFGKHTQYKQRPNNADTFTN
jgi:hypothetical protein